MRTYPLKLYSHACLLLQLSYLLTRFGLSNTLGWHFLRVRLGLVLLTYESDGKVRLCYTADPETM